ncbi:MAG TPA: glutathione S-transferase family protein [Gammaproteobacteria bacterium]|nr:glutathione S-transferase family protein [Gammaproteobacteria bacterium]
MKIYGDAKSGNCYKLKLLCALLSIEHEWIAVDILRGETRSEQFLAMNPNGQIPVCITDDGEVLTQSNAILYYLGQGSLYWPADLLAQTRVLEWQFFEQYSHEPGVAVARFIRLYQGMPANRQDEYQACLRTGYRALNVMEARLLQQDYLATDSVSLADISLYAYTHVAHEGGFDLSTYPAIRAWISRIQGLDDYVSMND